MLLIDNLVVLQYFHESSLGILFLIEKKVLYKKKNGLFPKKMSTKSEM